LAEAISSALVDGGSSMAEVDFRIADIAGEQYYFKEASLALSRTLRTRKESFDLWHPAECVGETGAAIGPLMLAVVDAACRKAYAPGPTVLCHAANDAGERMAVLARFGRH
jgi:3-oxoacyl-[acyl-carrier-protein] synthase-1